MAEPLDSAQGPPRPGRERALFLACTLALLTPIWAVRELPLQDLPIHVSNAAILERFLREDAPELHSNYRLHEALVPGALPHWLLAALIAVASPRIAGKLLVSATVLLVPLAARFAARALRGRRGASLAGWLALPFAWHYPLELGLVPFSLGLGLALLLLGTWAARRERPDARAAAAVGALALLLALTHLASLAFGLGALGCLALAHAAQEGRESGIRAALRRALPLLAATLPAVVLALGSASGSSYARARGGDENGHGLALQLATVLRLDALVSGGALDERLALATAVVLAAAVALALRARARRPEVRPADVALALAGLALVEAVRSRGGLALAFFLDQRWTLLAALLAVVWLGTQAIPARTRRALCALAAGLAAAFLVARAGRFLASEPLLDEYLSVAQVLPPGQRILPLTFAPAGFGGADRLPGRIAPLVHAASTVATDSHGVDLANPTFGCDFLPDAWPGALLAKRDTLNAALAYLAEGRSVDAVIVWAASPQDRELPGFQALLRRSERVFVSERGHLELYRASGR